jgi:hypothetical protein
VKLWWGLLVQTFNLKTQGVVVEDLEATLVYLVRFRQPRGCMRDPISTKKKKKTKTKQNQRKKENNERKKREEKK